MTVPILYTPEEVAEKVKVTRRSVYEWLLKGKLRGLRAGDNWRIAETDLMAFLESHMAAVPRIGPKHPDYPRWAAYFKRNAKSAPVKRTSATKANELCQPCVGIANGSEKLRSGPGSSFQDGPRRNEM
jgi:excisionase family DNA binding protein